MRRVLSFQSSHGCSAVAKTHNPPEHKVYLCGYRHGRLCVTVFPDFSCEPHAGEVGTSGDILLVGMHAACNAEQRFLGLVVYINGEPHTGPMVPNYFYLGPVETPRQHEMQFYFVTLAALNIPESFASFTSRRRNTGENFLMYVSRRCLPHREEAVQKLATLSTVTAGGRCHGVENSSAFIRHVPELAKGSWTDAYLAYSTFKFGLVMENTKKRGYITEKILNAFVGGTIPIYYGTETVFEIFNSKAFIYYDESNPEKTIEQVERLLHNRDLYNAMLSEPILAPGAFEKFFAVYDGGSTSKNIREFLGLSPFVAIVND